MDIFWSAHENASCFYAARLMCRDLPLIDVNLSRRMTGPVNRIVDRLHKHSLDVDDFWFDLVRESLMSKSIDSAVSGAVSRADANGRPDATLLSNDVSALRDAFLEHLSNLSEELRLRSRPLREQWEARGPGLLGSLEEWTGLPTGDHVTVLTVYPVCGGGGCMLAGQLVAIEAVLANPLARLPEVLRLGWLLSRISHQVDNEESASASPPALVAVALVPVILAAAERVELAECHAENIHLALRSWLEHELPDSSFDAKSAEALDDWFQEFRDHRMPWPDALVQLARSSEFW